MKKQLKPSAMEYAPVADPRTDRDLKTVTENLDDLHTRICRILDCSYIHTQALAQLFARAYVRDGQNAPTLTDSLVSITPQMLASFHERYALPPPTEVAMPSHAEQLAALYRQMSTAEHIRFYRELSSMITGTSPQNIAHIVTQILGQAEPIKPTAHGRIVYQHSIYTDEAFLHFSRVLPTAKACYSDSFTGVCEQVFDGECEYCILPLENTQDGKLVRFYGLIEKYELKIALTCKVTTSDNRHSTVFGLCRRGLAWPKLFVRDKSVLFEFMFWQENEHLSLSNLLHAAECASLSLVRADCLPRSDDEILIGAGYPFDLCFEVTPSKTSSASPPESDLLAFLMYLSVHSPTYLSLGIYQHL
ncbi:MAG: hypothetical protein IIX15_01090 [Clostridia bacterium]|nr:hypothetical protein [Clostridia bacterium]